MIGKMLVPDGLFVGRSAWQAEGLPGLPSIAADHGNGLGR